MQTEISHITWLDRSQQMTVDELVAISGLSEFELAELVDAGAVIPTDIEATRWSFTADCVPVVRKAVRLRDSLELDIHALVLAMKLLARIDVLENELTTLRARHSRFGG